MRGTLACLCLLASLAACAAPKATSTSLPPAVSYKTGTPAATTTLLPTLPGSSQPTPTPIIYTVVEGDTLIRIAAHFGITYEALLAANPTVQSSTLQVGTTLNIPAGSATPEQPSPTPAFASVLQARCWPEADGGLWCFALLQNQFAETLEDLSARFTLIGAGGQELANQVAYGLLDILPAGGSMPLAVHFPPSQPADASVRVDLLTSIRLLPGDVRYVPVQFENTLVSVTGSGRLAQVTGRLVLTGSSLANTVWVLATAYDAAGEVVGLRRWESPSALTADAPLPFNFAVSSLGPVIARVEFLVEARP